MASHPTLRIRIPPIQEDQLSPNLATGLQCPRVTSWCEVAVTPIVSPFELDPHDSFSDDSSLEEPSLTCSVRIQEVLSNNCVCPSICTTV